MAITQDDLDKLDAAIISGAKVVQFQDQKVEYQTTRDMLEARNFMAGILSSSQATTPVRQVRMITDRGL